jgi:hypothetical protein
MCSEWVRLRHAWATTQPLIHWIFFSLHMLPLVDMVSRDVLLSKLPFLVHVMFTFYTSGLWRAIVHHLKMICI